MAFRRRNIETPRIDLTAMIDVVFLLLIFYMITATFVDQPGLTIDLPESTAQQMRKNDKDLRVYLAADGKIYMEKQLVSFAEFQQRMQKYEGTAEKKSFVLMADAGALHGQVIQLMDAARAVGFGTLSIATDKLQAEQ